MTPDRKTPKRRRSASGGSRHRKPAAKPARRGSEPEAGSEVPAEQEPALDQESEDRIRAWLTRKFH